jgi:hypothetical protein
VDAQSRQALAIGFTSESRNGVDLVRLSQSPRDRKAQLAACTGQHDSLVQHGATLPPLRHSDRINLGERSCGINAFMSTGWMISSDSHILELPNVIGDGEGASHDHA